MRGISILIGAVLTASAVAAPEVTLTGPLRTTPDGGQVYRVELTGEDAFTPTKIGIRLEPREGGAVRPLKADGTNATAFFDRTIKPSGNVYEAAVYPRPDMQGALKVVGYARTATFPWDVDNDVRWLPVATLPAPDQSSPRDGKIFSAAPVFRVRIDTGVTVDVDYEFEVRGSGFFRAFTAPDFTTNAYGLYYTPWTGGFPLGTYEWRARGVDGSGTPGEWSDWDVFTASGGIDAAGAVSQTAFNQLKGAGWEYYFAAAWGGHNVWPDARNNLIRASNAGMKTACYVFLNFDNGSTVSGAPPNQTGDWQVDRALLNVGFTGDKGDLPFQLEYVMVDIENRFQGTMHPTDRVQRIAEAVQRIRNLGFRPMIYTRNEGFNHWWDIYTDFSTDFKELVLWDSKPETETQVFQDDLDLNVGNPWIPYGGWTERGGKQHLLDKFVFGARIDMNVWHPDVWTMPQMNPGRPSIPTPEVTAGLTSNGYQLQFNIRNLGNVEAYAVRVRDVKVQFTNIDGVHSVGMIPIGGQGGVAVQVPSSAGNRGAQVVVQFTVLTGNGPLRFARTVRLP